MPKPTAPSTEPKPKRTRVLSPGMQLLADEHKAKVAAHHASEKSAATLKRITEELLPKLTEADIRELSGSILTILNIAKS